MFNHDFFNHQLTPFGEEILNKIYPMSVGQNVQRVSDGDFNTLHPIVKEIWGHMTRCHPETQKYWRSKADQCLGYVSSIIQPSGGLDLPSPLPETIIPVEDEMEQDFLNDKSFVQIFGECMRTASMGMIMR
ncbi:MAG: hypothetical protein LBB19_01010, partial [Puniceicoccales bacterium]|nr:hypothetical protein [Puniceicoccales bacterium]